MDKGPQRPDGLDQVMPDPGRVFQWQIKEPVNVGWLRDICVQFWPLEDIKLLSTVGEQVEQ
eukprot:11463355-Heterocapsa_arctica.AAC.1